MFSNVSPAPFATAQTFAFDGTEYTIVAARVHGDSADGQRVTVREGATSVTLETVGGANLFENASTDIRTRVVSLDAWTRSRLPYVFSLAAHKIAAAR